MERKKLGKVTLKFADELLGQTAVSPFGTFPACSLRVVSAEV